MRKSPIKMLLALCLAVLMAASPLYAFAAEGTLPEQEILGDTVSQPEGGDASPTAGPSLPPDGSEPGADTSATSQPDVSPITNPDDSQPDASEPGDGDVIATIEPAGDGDSPQTTFRAALAELVTGGHEPYMSGYTGALFRPDRQITRAEVASVIYSLLKEKPENAQSSCVDVTGHWGYEAIAAMNTLGIMTGSKKRFRPDDPITRAEFVATLSRCFDMEEGQTTTKFSDVEGHWAYDNIAAVQQKGWIGGYPDGTFRPENKILRCEVVKVMNSALERRDEDFAKDKDKQEFKDVPRSHWAFEEIAEAADPKPEPSPSPSPTSEPTTAPGGFKVGDTVRVTAETGLNIRKAPVDGAVITAVVNGTLLSVTDVSKYPWLGVRTSGGIEGYSSAEYLVLHSGGGGQVIQNGDLSAKDLHIRQYMSARLDATADQNVSQMKWSSSNPSVAKVAYTLNYNSKEQSAIVYAGSPGTAVLTYSDGAGNKKGSCTVTVSSPAPVRFAYAESGIVQQNKDFDLIAITDNTRDEVRFEIVSGPAPGSFTSSAYTSESQASTHGQPTNHTRVFHRTVNFGVAGTYTFKAYASKNGVYDSEAVTFTVEVRSKVNYTEATNETRRASGRILREIQLFEGTVHEIEDDKLVQGHPTVGCGYVVRTNITFYNNVTNTEAYAQMAGIVDNDIYSKAVENFRRENNIKMSQAQFDALLSFAYNCGTGTVNPSSSDAAKIILNCVTPPKDASESNPYVGYANVASTFLYSLGSTDSQKVASVPQGARVTVTGIFSRHGNGRNEETWYRATLNGKTGWVPAGYIKLNADLPCDLTYADSTSLANEILKWHMAGGAVTAGLVYRRLAECKIFFFGNYDECMGNSAKYRKNTYGFVYPDRCAYLEE